MVDFTFKVGLELMFKVGLDLNFMFKVGLDLNLVFNFIIINLYYLLVIKEMGYFNSYSYSMPFFTYFPFIEETDFSSYLTFMDSSLISLNLFVNHSFMFPF